MYKMEEEKIKQVLKKIAGMMNSLGVEWSLVGSVNLLLQGMNVRPRDLDITISYRDFGKIKEFFSDFDFKIRDLSNGEAQEILFSMDGFDIQICADYEHGIYYKKRCEEGSTKLIDVGGITVPVFTLESESECYRLTGRQEKVNKIREFINN